MSLAGSATAASIWPAAGSELREFLDRLPAAAYTCDAGGLITYFNGRAVELWGRAPRINDPADRYCGSWRLYSRDGEPIEHRECWMAKALGDRTQYNAREAIVERPDGTRRDVLAYAGPMYGEGAQLVGAINVLWDVTEKRRAEAAIRGTERRTEDLLATVAHALRNPLTPLTAGVDIIRASIDDPETIAEHCTLMQGQLQQLARVVDDLLDLTLHGRRELRFARARVDLKAVVRTAVEENRGAIAQAGHTLSVALPFTPLPISADPLRLGQALSQLLRNASRYTPQGGEIALRATRDGDRVRVTVRDTGVGIPTGELETIFAPFERLDRSLETGYEGLGIGLTLVRACAEMHGGSIEARSDGPGRGSEFCMILPLLAEVRAEASSAAVRPGAEGASRRVLLVDDNPQVSRSLSRLVRMLGHDIRVAYDGREALSVADEFQPDVVLLDIGLPQLNGYDAARALRARRGAAVTLVAVTGWGGEEDRRRSREAGFDRHLTKPVEASELAAVLRA